MKRTCALIAGGFIAGLFVTAFFKYLPSNSGEWASWVQAVGSIGAIAGAVWVASSQSVNARREKQAAIFAVAHAAVEEARKIRNYLIAEDPEDQLRVNYHKSILESYFGALSNCPVHELHSPVAVTALLMLRDQFLFLRESVETCLAGPAKQPQWKDLYEDLDGVLISDENARQLRTRMEGQRAVLRRNVEVHINAIETRYTEMVSALGSAVLPLR
ncbi:hypothetical protein [Cupriavidus plantarum]|uniref:hypothetical protein n=1 Tax=Cupriavidus plantarum TaxID=942865 RepID=UPI00339D619E